MSIKTWKKEFYPVPARVVKAEDAAKHSLRKWIGILPKNLARHGLYRTFTDVISVSTGNDVFSLDGSTCALCQRFYGKKANAFHECLACPLFKATNQACGVHVGNAYDRACEDTSPTSSRAVMAMIRALEKACKIKV